MKPCSVGNFFLGGVVGIYNIHTYIYIQCEAPKIAKLVNITPITMVYGTYNELVTGANLNQLTSLGGLTLLVLCHVYINSYNIQLYLSTTHVYIYIYIYIYLYIIILTIWLFNIAMENHHAINR